MQEVPLSTKLTKNKKVEVVTIITRLYIINPAFKTISNNILATTALPFLCACYSHLAWFSEKGEILGRISVGQNHIQMAYTVMEYKKQCIYITAAYACKHLILLL